MNYVDLPQQQFTNEHTYPTYLAKQQSSTNVNQSLDDQIHMKLFSLQQRSNQYQSYQHRQNNYAFRNRIIPNDSTPQFVKTDQRSDDDEEEEEEDDEHLDDHSHQQKSSKLGNYSSYYSEQYTNIDEQFDLASVVIWYKNVMQSVKKFLWVIDNGETIFLSRVNRWRGEKYISMSIWSLVVVVYPTGCD